MPPKTIAGRYVVERAVGQGGMGTVWLCRDQVLGRSVAVKQVGTMPGESVADINRALREARSSAALNHRNVVSVYDTVEDDGHHWLVMEYVASRTLGEILAQDGPLTLERAAWIGAQAADGLAAAHARGTMHRDVKPGNILVTDDDHVKIMDFGISRTHGDEQLTRSGIITGTPLYFSPEIARGEEPGLPADVWALGATLYAAVEGQTPYPDQGNAIALLATITSEPTPPPQQAGVLAEPIGRMMDPDPATRWSMADAATALHRIHDQPVTDPPEPTVALTAADLPTREEPRPPPEDERRRRPGWLLPLAAVVLLALVAVAGFALMGGNGDGTPAADESSAPTSTDDVSDQPAPDDAETPSTEPPAETPAETDTEPPPSAEPPAAGDPEAFTEEYYGYLPDDTKSAYDLLSPTYGSSYGEYQGFWRTIEDVAVRGASEVEGETAVDVDLTYTNSDGTTQNETRRLFLEQTDDGYLIVDDAVV